ncbi:MAG: bifunctional pyr operon transcriptional regulator/uracil phosphoribosyltransferase PyrR [Deltaproteobacteria bacterium]|nr:bifunctional pyr operon transcriptional regulator/uracil phosphoribosyltransferase PyrR [Deltaproteobacteria bacterium]
MKGIKKKTALNDKGIHEALDRMVTQMVADYPEMERLVLIGIRTGGAFLADRIQKLLKAKKGLLVPTGALDITLYRDDWTRINHKPIVGKTEVPVCLDNKIIILVDDVLYTGRTVRAAMDALIDFGRPRRISLAVLVDRGGRELPISADYTAIRLDVKSGERVNVYFKEMGNHDQVVIENETEVKN